MATYRAHVLVCMGSNCVIDDSQGIAQSFNAELERTGLSGEVRIVETGCFGMCNYGPTVVIYPGGVFYCKVTPEDVPEIVSEHLINGRLVHRLLYDGPETPKTMQTVYQANYFKKQQRIVLRNCGIIDPESIDEYIASDGYSALRKCLTDMSPQEVIDEVKESGLRGRGGAAFPTGLKWQFTQKASGQPKYVVCNADEGEPGTFKDRLILEGDPHSLIESMAIAGYAIGSNKGYMYIRGEYTLSIERMQLAIEQARQRGFLGENILGTEFSFDIEIRQGAGSYVCGEETALIASIEGKRGEPFYKPPYPTDAGLWGKPTLINNVETLANIPPIIMQGGRWFKEIGTAKSPGTKVFTLTGNVANKGLIEVPMGITLREVVYEIGGGIPGGHKFKMAQTGGTSGGCIPAEQLDLPMDYDTLAEAGTALGSGALLIIDDTHCIVDIVKCFMQFFKNESCGKCTPCREGTYQMYHILDRISKGKGNPKDIDNMMVLSRTMMRSSLCGLGQAAPNPVVTTLYFYRDEYNAHIRDKVCPAGVCPIKKTEGPVLPASHSVRTIPTRDR
ncbi:MAG TPA: NADH-quinone oxidoreductase subunit NuoF [Bacillota bacterium]|nr:NADH-quinone oxidoreductase subunit NuoF [Bacillota bacterium]